MNIEDKIKYLKVTGASKGGVVINEDELRKILEYQLKEIITWAEKRKKEWWNIDDYVSALEDLLDHLK